MIKVPRRILKHIEGRQILPYILECINSLVTHNFSPAREKKNKTERNQEHLPIVVKSGLARIHTCTYGNLETRKGGAPASGMSVVDEQGRGCRRGAWG